MWHRFSYFWLVYYTKEMCQMSGVVVFIFFFICLATGRSFPTVAFTNYCIQLKTTHFPSWYLFCPFPLYIVVFSASLRVPLNLWRSFIFSRFFFRSNSITSDTSTSTRFGPTTHLTPSSSRRESCSPTFSLSIASLCRPYSVVGKQGAPAKRPGQAVGGWRSVYAAGAKEQHVFCRLHVG